MHSSNNLRMSSLTNYQKGYLLHAILTIISISYRVQHPLVILHIDLVKLHKHKVQDLDRKARPVAAPLPKDSWEWIKRVASNPSLQDPAGIGHRFTNKTLRELKIGGGGFLLPTEEDQFRRMLERHGKSFTFSPGEIRCVDLTIVKPMVIFTVPPVSWSLKPI